MATLNRTHMFTVSGIFEVSSVVSPSYFSYFFFSFSLFFFLFLFLLFFFSSHFFSSLFSSSFVIALLTLLLRLQSPFILGKKYSYLSSNVTITCNGADREEPFAYEISTLGYGEAHQALKHDEMKMMKGRLIASNAINLVNQVLIYEPARALKVGDSETFTEALHDSTAVTSLGIIKSSSTIIKKCEQTFHKGEDSTIPKLTTVLVVLHADWHPLVCISFFFFLLTSHPFTFLFFLIFSSASWSTSRSNTVADPVLIFAAPPPSFCQVGR